jgi:hypothetical protein
VANGPVLSLVADRECYDASLDQITVTVRVDALPEPIVGAQFFLGFESEAVDPATDSVTSALRAPLGDPCGCTPAREPHS